MESSQQTNLLHGMGSDSEERIKTEYTDEKQKDSKFSDSENVFPNLSASIRRSTPASFSQPIPKRVKLVDKPSDNIEIRYALLDWKRQRLNSVARNYNEHLLYCYFHENDINVLDIQTIYKNPPFKLFNYIEQYKLEGDNTLEAKFKSNLIHKVETEPDKRNVSVKKEPKYKFLSTDSSAVSSDQLVEKARQEAYIIQRISTLKKEGLWSERKLPKIQEPLRPKAHWDYLLEEMVWLSADFAQERKWKKAAAKKCAKMVHKYFQEKNQLSMKMEKEQEVRLRKIAGFMAKEVRTFWNNISKLIEFKMNAKLDEKKKRVLDQQLSFIVDQTEKYSSMLAESMQKPELSRNSSRPDTPTTTGNLISDDEFCPKEESSDNEETILKEDDNAEEQASELQLLQKESEKTFDDLLNDLPPEYLEDSFGISLLDNTQTFSSEKVNPPLSLDSEKKKSSTTEANTNLQNVEKIVHEPKKQTKNDQDSEKLEQMDVDDQSISVKDVDDADFSAKEDSSDDEETLVEQEKQEKDNNVEQEIKDLENENEMSVEELRKKYEALAAASEPYIESSGEESSNDSSGDESATEVEKSGKDADSVKKEVENKSRNDKNEADESSEEGSAASVESEEEDLNSDDEDDFLGLKELISDKLPAKEGVSMSQEESEKVDKELEDASAVAQSLQPKGFTLSSTSVTTPIPFLLRHKLREYQHVGLDWLVTMYEKKLNGILADEMGLGKTIQTIALLAHLAVEKEIWAPHLIVVPTSVMLNWEMEFKKWCPAFKILTYYGSQKERKLKRQGWTKHNNFHVCITSYKLVIQDHQSFRRKKWCYFILDEAQNIKNFKSQRWQLLLNFQSQRRLLLTGTPLQNNLMELWSLMHFLMPHVFASHRDFRDWFSNPVTGMIEGNKEYNEHIIKRLHKVLRPFILRRLKSEVEQQMPKKYEHVIMCRLSKRQRFLYEEFMSRTKTKETLATGNFLSVINILMQLRKVCNHPNLFEARPIVSPFIMDKIDYFIPSLVYNANILSPFQKLDLLSLNFLLVELELSLTAFAAHRIRRVQAPRKLIEEIDSRIDPPPKCPAGKIRLHVRPSSQPLPKPGTITNRSVPSIVTLKQVTSGTSTTTTSQSQSSGVLHTGVRFQLVQHGGSYKAIPLPPGSTGGMLMQQTPQGPRLIVPQRSVQTSNVPSTISTSSQVSGGLQLVQASSGQYLLTSPIQKSASGPPTSASIGVSGNQAVALLQKLQGLKGLQGSVITTGAGGRTVLRLPTSSLRPPATTFGTSSSNNINASALAQAQSSIGGGVKNNSISSKSHSLANSPVTSPSRNTRSHSKVPDEKIERKKEVKNIFTITELDERRKKIRREKLSSLARINTRRCQACPIYGSDLVEAVCVATGPIIKAALSWRGPFNGQGLVHCRNASNPSLSQYWNQASGLTSLIKTPEDLIKEIKYNCDKFSLYIPSVVAPPIDNRVPHPHPSKVQTELYMREKLKIGLQKPLAPLYSRISASNTQFPDARLIQYDCGKLQTLDVLLRDLKRGHHRVLIFTQMTKMLDVFEAFLNYHGHLYLRLDGSTKIEQRQTLMERFNQDKRIFVFILSTRSGGIGVNLTGADTVIFYDSDWNPTMDAQAQDRCHRIGQTRDVHIYRLISEKTIEENILKKANQKRLLGDLAIEGGNFTTASLKTSTIQDLFEIDSNEQDASKRMSEILKDKSTEPEKGLGDLESALAVAEDVADAEATKTAKAEAAAELVEFDENVPLEELPDDDAVSKADNEVNLLMKQLTPIERYAMNFMENCDDDIKDEAQRLEAEIDEQKKEWEMGRMQALKEEEERMREGENEDMLTYSSIDAHNQVKKSVMGRGFTKKLGKDSALMASPRKRGRPRKFVQEVVENNTGVIDRSRSRYVGSGKNYSASESESCKTKNVLKRGRRRVQNPRTSSAESSSSNESSNRLKRKAKQSSTKTVRRADRGTNSPSSGEKSDASSSDEEKSAASESSEESLAGYETSNTSSNSSDEDTNKNSKDVEEAAPRTRSRGDINVNLWTLDKVPLPVCRRERFRASSQSSFDSARNSPALVCSKDGAQSSPIMPGLGNDYKALKIDSNIVVGEVSVDLGLRVNISDFPQHIKSGSNLKVEDSDVKVVGNDCSTNCNMKSDSDLKLTDGKMKIGSSDLKFTKSAQSDLKISNSKLKISDDVNIDSEVNVTGEGNCDGEVKIVDTDSKLDGSISKLNDSESKSGDSDLNFVDSVSELDDDSKFVDGVSKLDDIDSKFVDGTCKSDDSDSKFVDSVSKLDDSDLIDNENRVNIDICSLPNGTLNGHSPNLL